MESFSIKDFVEKVEVKREYVSDTCEYEVTKMAMEFYLKYPCYKEWNIFLHGNSIGNYMRNKEQKYTKDYRGSRDYIGAYLLKKADENKVLTADILTSKSSLIKLCERYLTKEKFSECKCYYRAFETVYYWCGNMVPVICSFSPGRGDRSAIDNWKAKLDLLYKFSDKASKEKTDYTYYIEFLEGNGKCHKQNQLWPGWINDHWKNNMEEFIKQNYLYDYIQNGITKKIVDEKDNTNFVSIINNDLDDLKLIKTWFCNNTKLVIQRSYRILNEVETDFSEEQKKNIKLVFKEIFSEAQIPENEITLCLF